MRFTTQSEYALVCLRRLCMDSSAEPVSVHTLAEAENMSRDYVEQLFLKLKRAGIINSVKGVHGGYLLAREPERITLKEIIEALEGQTFEVFCTPEMREKIVCMYHAQSCSIRPVWRRFKELADDFFSRITLAELLMGEETVESGLKQMELAQHQLAGARAHG